MNVLVLPTLEEEELKQQLAAYAELYADGPLTSYCLLIRQLENEQGIALQPDGDGGPELPAHHFFNMLWWLGQADETIYGHYSSPVTGCGYCFGRCTGEHGDELLRGHDSHGRAVELYVPTTEFCRSSHDDGVPYQQPPDLTERPLPADTAQLELQLSSLPETALALSGNADFLATPGLDVDWFYRPPLEAEEKTWSTRLYEGLVIVTVASLGFALVELVAMLAGW